MLDDTQVAKLAQADDIVDGHDAIHGCSMAVRWLLHEEDDSAVEHHG